tara:strand:- start:122 stop:418 length:297 start_codon:yes stop_codon:yes gene_type:complete
MAKNTSKKIKELKGVKPEKITQEQLDRVQKVVNSINKTNFKIGNLEVEKHELMHSIAGLKDEMTLLQTEFEKEYGTYDIDIRNGEINYPKNGKVNKKD